MANNDIDNMKLVSDTNLAKHFGVSRNTIWRWVREGLIPEPYRIGKKVSRWDLHQVHEILFPKDSVPKAPVPNGSSPQKKQGHEGEQHGQKFEFTGSNAL